MTKKTLTVDTPNGQIEVEEGDRFYLLGGSAADKKRFVVAYRPESLVEDYPWQLTREVDGEFIRYMTPSIDFTRPAPDEDGWIEHDSDESPVSDNTIVEWIDPKGRLRTATPAYCLPWKWVAKYRIVEEEEGPEEQVDVLYDRNAQLEDKCDDLSDELSVVIQQIMEAEDLDDLKLLTMSNFPKEVLNCLKQK